VLGAGVPIIVGCLTVGGQLDKPLTGIYSSPFFIFNRGGAGSEERAGHCRSFRI